LEEFLMPEEGLDLKEGSSVEGSYKGTIVLFKDVDCRGDAILLENSYGVKNLKDLKWNDRMSSFLIVSGFWRFYENTDWKKVMGQDCHPGTYRDCTKVGMKKGKLSSLECIGP